MTDNRVKITPCDCFSLLTCVLLLLAVFGVSAMLFSIPLTPSISPMQVVLLTAPLVVAHGAGMLWRYRKLPLWLSETAHTLGILAFGAALYAVARMFELPDLRENILLVCGMMSLALGIILNSRTQCVVSALSLIVWTSEWVWLSKNGFAYGHIWGYDPALSPLTMVAVALMFFPVYFFAARRMNSPMLLLMTLIGGIVVNFFTIGYMNMSVPLGFFLLFPMFLFALPKLLPDNGSFPLYPKLFRFFGGLILVPILMFLCTRYTLVVKVGFSVDSALNIVYAVILFGTMGVAVAVAFLRTFTRRDELEFRDADFWLDMVFPIMIMLVTIVSLLFFPNRFTENTSIPWQIFCLSLAWVFVLVQSIRCLVCHYRHWLLPLLYNLAFLCGAFYYMSMFVVRQGTFATIFNLVISCGFIALMMGILRAYNLRREVKS